MRIGGLLLVLLAGVLAIASVGRGETTTTEPRADASAPVVVRPADPRDSATGARSFEGNVGEQKVLVIRATWGPEPFSAAEVQDAIAAADAFVRSNSFGKTWLVSEMTPWYRSLPRAPRCDESVNEDAVKGAAQRAGYNLTQFAALIMIMPRPAECTRGAAGVFTGRDIWLFGFIDRRVVVHEIGHAFTLDHAYRWECSGGRCEAVEYGDPYTVMGHGQGQYNAFEKYRAGWLTREQVSRPGANGDYTIDQLEEQGTLPKALVVRTARHEWWFDHREPLREDAIFAGTPIVRGLLVHTGPPETNPNPRGGLYLTPDTLLPNPGGHGHDALLPGDSFGERGAFQIQVLRHVERRVDVRFRWTDTTRPGAPRITRPRGRVRGGTMNVSWRVPNETGSGVARYEVSIDGKRKVTVDGDNYLPEEGVSLRAPRRGRHVLSVVAVDRAGNRGRPGRVRLRR